MKISFVIPCYRSENTVRSVIDEIVEKVRERNDIDYEIIAVNDQSPDKVLEVLIAYAENMPQLKVIDLAKNMGKHAALMAGYSYTTGDYIVNVDDDGQCPVDRLWDLLAPLDGDYDVSIAAYSVKEENALKRFGSRMNDYMAQLLIDKEKGLQITNFSAMKRFVCDEILRYHNAYPYIDGLILRTTKNIANVNMEERKRISGTTGYTFRKSLRLWINGFTAFSVKPLRIASFIGIIISILGFLFSLIVVLRKIIHPEISVGYSSLMSVLLFVSGILMIMLGLIGEYVGRIYISLNNSPIYVIRNTWNIDHMTEDRLK